MSNDFLKMSDFSSASKAVLCFEPAAFLVNKGAEKLWKNHRITARFVCSLQYLTNPIDRTLQAIATPIFATGSFIYVTRAAYCKKFQDGQPSLEDRLEYLGRKSLKLLPCVAAKTICILIPLSLNTAIHIIFPFKVISACKDDRPENFFNRRKYVRSDIKRLFRESYIKEHCLGKGLNDYNLPSPLRLSSRHLFSVLLSDKKIAKQLRLHLVHDPYLTGYFPPETDSFIFEKRVAKYERSPIERDRVAHLRKNLRPPSKADLESFRGRADKFAFSCHVASLLSAKWYDEEGCIDIPSAFFLPMGFDSLSKEQQVQEVRWRFGYYLKMLDALKVSISLDPQLLQDPLKLSEAGAFHLWLSALVIDSYEKFIASVG